MKILKNIRNVILFILGVAFFIFALSMSMLLLNFNKYGLTQFGDTTFVLINNDIVSDVYKKGDLVFAESHNIMTLKEGEMMFAYRVDSQGGVHVDLGKIGHIYPEENAISFENGNTYSTEFLAGVPTNHYKSVGTFLSVVESKWGFLFIVLVPCFLIFLYEIYALIVEIKYGGEEENA